MANKEAIFTLRVDTGNSVAEINAFEKGLIDATQEIKDLDKSIDDLSSASTNLDHRMTDVTATFAEVYGELQPLTARMGEAEDRLYELALAGDTASKEYKQLLDQVAKYKKAQIETDMVVDRASKTIGERLVGSVGGAVSVFSGFQSALALVGVENEKLMQTMVKLQAAMGLASALQEIQLKLKEKDALFSGIQNTINKLGNFIRYGTIHGIQTQIVATENLIRTEAAAAVVSEREAAAIKDIGEASIIASSETRAFDIATNQLSESNTAAAITAEREAGAIKDVGEATIIASAETKAFSTSQKAAAVATGLASNAMKILRAALVTTGIGAIVVAVGYLIENFDKVWKVIERTVMSMKGLTAVLEFFGIIDDANTRNAVKNAQTTTEIIEIQTKKKIAAERQKMKATEDNYTLEIRMSQAAGKNTEQMEERKLAAALKSGRAILELQNQKIKGYRLELQTLFDLGKGDSDRAIQLVKNIKENKKLAGEQYAENKKNLDDLTVLRIANDKAEADRQKEAADKAKERRKAAAEAEKARLKELYDLQVKANEDRISQMDAQFALEVSLMKDAREKEIQELVMSYDEKFQVANGNAELEKAVAAQLNADIAAINKRFFDEELAKRAEQEQKKLELYKNFRSFMADEFQRELYDFEDAQAEQSQALGEALQLNVITADEYMQAQLKLEDEYNKKVVELNKAKNDAIKEQEIKSREEQLAGVTQMLETAQMVFDQISAFNTAVNDLQNARMENAQAAADDQIATLEKQHEAELSSSSLTAEQREMIDKKYASAKYAIELKNFNEVEKIKKQQFERDKALRIAQVAIDTATAIVKGIAQFGPPPSPAGIAAIASASIIGATQIAAIAAQKYQSGTAPSLDTGGGVTAGATAGELGGAGTNANLNTQQQNTAELIAQTNQGVVYVLESDITGTQNKVAMQNKLSVW